MAEPPSTPAAGGAVRLSRLLGRTLRDDPTGAEAASDRLLQRAGYVRRHASGLYAWLPLGRRLLHRVEAVVRAELDAGGASEVLLPAPQSAEMATTLATAEIGSHRDLPAAVYQVRTKRRDEPRLRGGVLRSREFLVADAYSFDPSDDDLAATYDRMLNACRRALERCELDAVAVEAGAGSIGGRAEHELMVATPAGDVRYLRCSSPGCSYAASAEAARAGLRWFDRPPFPERVVEHHTPGRSSIDAVVALLRQRGNDVSAAGVLKCLALVDGDGSPVVAVVPGDREVRVPGGLRPFDDAAFARFPVLHPGSIGPSGLQEHGVRVVADPLVKQPITWVAGANRPDHHVSGLMLGRDFRVDEWAPIATVVAGDPCCRCGSALESVQAFEVGHTVELGLGDSAGVTFLDPGGVERPVWTGRYAIGVSRLAAVVAEVHHDAHGLVWPAEPAPFDVHLLALGADRSAEVAAAADELADALAASGVAVLRDDRAHLSAGAMFADADLLGVPTQLVVGARGLARGVVERKARRTGDRDELDLAAAADEVAAAVKPRSSPRPS